ncbi:MAG: AmmeMemoRadiSam system radical SAM enzyme [Oscillospiraceae bacterium]|jgi:pyruvate formate lyase activating enzyme|nr:AmmeMemoRadiSam system radical SAM enzyme [Oscillospiraceae bacterium]
MICNICPHKCRLEENQIGLCRARVNRNGKIICANYGLITSIAVDPIEKKPLYRFHAGRPILSVGSYGCNMFCSFCQNSGISQQITPSEYISPQELIKIALSVPDNTGVAFTYNEPLISYEYLMDCAPLLREAGLKVVLVTNGMINSEPLERLLAYTDALNIDLKAFTDGFYKKHGGDLETVKRNIEACARQCHVEITTLIIPGENDSTDEMQELSAWLSGVSRDLPYHISRFFPRYNMTEKLPTSKERLLELADIAREYLNYVYIGNI